MVRISFHILILEQRLDLLQSSKQFLSFFSYTYSYSLILMDLI